MPDDSVLDLVTGVMTVITFAGQASRVCTTLYESRSIDENLEVKAMALRAAADTMSRHCAVVQPQNPDEKRLASIAQSCHAVAEDLLREIGAYNGCSNGIWGSLRTATVAFWKQSKFRKLEKSLDDYKSILLTDLITRLCTRSDAALLQQEKQFVELSTDFKQVISQLSMGHDGLSAQVSEEHGKTRNHITKEVKKAHESTEKEIKRVPADASTEAQRQKLLQSFKYPGMNERRNQIEQAHSGTFHWVMHSRGEDCEQCKDISSEIKYEINGDGHKTPDSSSSSDTQLDLEIFDAFDSFIEWLRSDKRVYWISGHRDSGKSTLVRYVSGSPETMTALQDWLPGALVLTHYFWKSGSSLQRSVKGFWCSLAYQLLSANLGMADSFLDKFPQMKLMQEPGDWSPGELQMACLELLSTSAPHCIFIDGLDEVDDADGVETLQHIASEILRKKGRDVKLCLASSPEYRFRLWLQDCPRLNLQNLTNKGMMQSVEDTMKMVSESFGGETVCEVRDKLVAQA